MDLEKLSDSLVSAFLHLENVSNNKLNKMFVGIHCIYK